jgi:hypothetical protein
VKVHVSLLVGWVRVRVRVRVSRKGVKTCDCTSRRFRTFHLNLHMIDNPTPLRCFCQEVFTRLVVLYF